MADITMPNTVVAGTATDPAPLLENLWDPAVPETSLAVLEGGLTRPNYTPGSGPVLTWREIRPRTQSVGWGHGVTANRDYFQSLFDIGNVDLDIPANAPEDRYIAVAGPVRTFRLPYDLKFLLMSWTLCTQGDGVRQDADPASNEGATMALFFDGFAVTATRRFIPRTLLSNGPPPGTPLDGPPFRSPPNGIRHYSGHHTEVNVSSGWHKAGVRVISNARQTRFHVSGIRIIGFR